MATTIKADVLAPSELGLPEQETWNRMIDETPALQRAFLSYDFALACERAGMLARVAIFHFGGRVVGFFPFQFSSLVHRTLQSAVRIGGEMNDCATAIMHPDVAIDIRDLMATTGLSALLMTHIPVAIPALPRPTSSSDQDVSVGHIIDFSAGADAYTAQLEQRNKPFVQDTIRRAAKMAKEVGEPVFSVRRSPSWLEARAVIDEKRLQYKNTGAIDVFSDPRRVALIEALCATRSPRCVAHFSKLEAAGVAVAMHLGLACHSTLNYWFPTYRPEARKYSPGRQLIWQTIQRCREEQLTLIDRGEGDTQAKQEFSTMTQRFWRGAWYAGGITGRLARLTAAAEWRISMLHRKRGASD